MPDPGLGAGARSLLVPCYRKDLMKAISSAVGILKDEDEYSRASYHIKRVRSNHEKSTNDAQDSNCRHIKFSSWNSAAENADQWRSQPLLRERERARSMLAKLTIPN